MPMTTGLHFTTGPSLITWNGIELGVSENGVEHQIQQYIQDVPSDDFGGTSGSPSDQQWLGATAMVQCVLTKFIEANVEQLINHRFGQTGTFGQVGEFMKQDILYAELVIWGRNELRTYPCAYVRQPVSMNSGSRFRRWGISFYCQVLDSCQQELYIVNETDDPCGNGGS